MHTEEGPVKARVTAFDLKLEMPGEISIRIDGEGRWCTFRRGYHFYRRTMDGQVVKRRAERTEILDDSSAEAVHREIGDVLSRSIRQIRSGSGALVLSGDDPTRTALACALEKSASWTPEDYAGETVRFEQAYPEKVPILPPDRYRDLVVLPATGCPNGACSFCAFYRGRGFRPLSSQAFEKHLFQVKRLFGKAGAGRNGVFLGSANALALSQKRMLHIQEMVNAVFGSRKRGIAAFYDPEYAPQRSVRDWVELAGLDLTRLVIGLETGLPKLRNRLGKKAHPDLVARAVGDLKRGGIQLGLTILLGAGGPISATAHREATVSFVQDLSLDDRDLIYLSPLEGSLEPDLMEEESIRFRLELKSRTAAKVMPYHMEHYHYYS